MKQQFLIPYRTMVSAVRAAAMAVAKQDHAALITGICVEIEGEKISMVATDGYRLFSQVLPTLEGNYPNYKQIIPEKFKYEIKVDRDTLLGALVSVPGRQQDGYSVVMAGQDGQLNLKGQNKSNLFVAVSIPADGNLDVTLNSVHLTHALKALPVGDVLIRSNEPKKAILIVSAIENSGAPETLLVPIRS